MPSERMIAAAAQYIASADRCKRAWSRSFERDDESTRLTVRELAEMHGAGLGLLWTTHTNDLRSALAVLQQVEACGSPLTGGPQDGHIQAKCVLESRVH
jgi:hypothetical protein